MNLQAVFNSAVRRNTGRLLILSYSHVDAGLAQAGPPARDDLCGVPRGEFEWQMEQVSNRFAPIVLSRLMGHLGGKRPLAGPQICLSLHSNDVQDHKLAAPVLRRRSLPATWFVEFESIQESDSDSRSESEQELNWAVIRELSAAGDEMAHRVRADSATPTMDSVQRRARLSALRRRVEEATGVSVCSFAHDGDLHGGPGRVLICDAAIAGFSLGVSGDEGVNALRPINPLMLMRRAVSGEMTRVQFQSLLDGFERGA